MSRRGRLTPNAMQATIAAAEICKDCGRALRRFGPAWRNGVCLCCYQKLLRETWQTYYGNLTELKPGMRPRTVSIGNLPGTTTNEEVAAWVREQMGIEKNPTLSQCAAVGEAMCTQVEHLFCYIETINHDLDYQRMG